jgi:lipid-binding SYLF domain-containing protein
LANGFRVKEKELFMRNSIAMLILPLAACLSAPGAAGAGIAKEIDAHLDAAVNCFVSKAKGAWELLGKANAVLVIPHVIKGGIIIGGEGSEDSLRAGSWIVGYYSTASASFGLTFGGEVKDLIILFIDEQSYREFRKSKGWKAGGRRQHSRHQGRRRGIGRHHEAAGVHHRLRRWGKRPPRGRLVQGFHVHAH